MNLSLPAGGRRTCRRLLFDALHRTATAVVTPVLAPILKWGRAPFRHLFILTHMRSASTVLVHILNSHPDIVGYGESHTQYRDFSDLDRLLVKTAFFFRRFRFDERYLMDKIAHNYPLCPPLLRAHLHDFVFLLREPSAAIPSICRFNHLQPAEAGRYYEERLVALRQTAAMIAGERCLFLDHADLCNQPAVELSRIQRFLGLTSPLTLDYAKHRGTGMRFVGDTSPAIHTGRFAPSLPRLQDESAVTPRLVACYEETRAFLLERCAGGVKPSGGHEI